MKLTEEERLMHSEEILKDRIIAHSAYCRNCGYNLRLQPKTGRCPECGSHYDTRALTLNGIFLPQDMDIPLADALGTLVCWGMAAVLIANAIKPYSPTPVYCGVLLIAMGAVYANRAWKGISLFMRFREVVRKIREEEDE